MPCVRGSGSDPVSGACSQGRWEVEMTSLSPLMERGDPEPPNRGHHVLVKDNG